MLKVQARKLGDVTILCLQGKIITGETTTLGDAVMAQSYARAVVLDLSRVSRIDAGGIGVMLELREKTRSKGIEFKLINVSGPVKQILEITCLNSVFEISSEVNVSGTMSHNLPASALRAPCFQEA